MRKLFHAFIAVGAIIPAQIASAAPTCQNLVGQWKNELNSTFTVASVDAATGRIEGTYNSPSGTSGDAYTAIGWTNISASGSATDVVPAITFSVRYTPYGSVAAWSGTCRIVNGVATIRTVWHLTRSKGDFSWDHQLTGADIFTAIP